MASLLRSLREGPGERELSPRRSGLAVLVPMAFAVTFIVNACASAPNASHGPPADTAAVASASGSTSPAALLSAPPATAARSATPTSADERLVNTLVIFARTSSAYDFAALPFADRVSLGLADQIRAVRDAADLARRDAWVLQVNPFRAHVGPFSAIELLTRDLPTKIVIGSHAHCASPPVPAPSGFERLRRVSIQPTGIDTCLLWWTVDLFVSTTGQIEAITLDLWEP
jgi:hypothetical protein